MPTYLLISLGASSAAIDTAVQAKISKEDSHQVEPGKWLITSTAVTSKDVSDSLGISDSTTFLIAPIRGYFGRAKPDLWEWLAAKSTKVNG
jgi:hypothetical protein